MPIPLVHRTPRALQSNNASQVATVQLQVIEECAISYSLFGAKSDRILMLVRTAQAVYIDQQLLVAGGQLIHDIHNPQFCVLPTILTLLTWLTTVLQGHVLMSLYGPCD